MMIRGLLSTVLKGLSQRFRGDLGLGSTSVSLVQGLCHCDLGIGLHTHHCWHLSPSSVCYSPNKLSEQMTVKEHNGTKNIHQVSGEMKYLLWITWIWVIYI